MEPLAISIRTPSLFINPKVFNPSMREVFNLANALRKSPDEIRNLAKKRSYFAWLKRKSSPEVAERIMSMKIRGVYEVREPARFYPAESAAANLLGIVGMDDHGLLGLERQYESQLGGDPIRYIQTRDAKGQLIYEQAKAAAPAKPGHSIVLTIDKAIQHYAEKALADGVKAAKAKSGFAVVLDPHTGKILALANVPTFNPNHTDRLDLKKAKNFALLDQFEPGSVMKTFVIADALERNIFKESDLVSVEDGKLRVGNRTIHDSHKPEHDQLSVAQVLIESSNVGIYKIAQKLGKRSVDRSFRAFGFGTKKMTNGFPGQVTGSLSSYKTWKEIRFANLAFGQGLTTSGLELVAAYSAFANGGSLVKPTYIEKVIADDGSLIQAFKPPSGKRVISPETALKIRRMLFKSVEDGAIKAKMSTYTAGGKTGTSQKIDPKTRAYSRTKHVSSFVGMAPIGDPHLVVYVQINEPNQPLSYGSIWAAPVFKEITEPTLRYLNVAPDRDKQVGKLTQRGPSGGNQQRY